MAVISISRGSYSHGKEIAERVAERLGYTCISREVLLAASETFNIPEIKLARALHEAPSFWDKLSFGKQEYLAYVQCALLEYARKDNLVYHGLGGQFILRDVRHALKVYVLADVKTQLRVEMQRGGLTKADARAKLKRDDHERTEWALGLWGTDPLDPGLFDLMVHLRRITVEGAVDLICLTSSSEPFQTTPESQKAVEDLLLAAQVRSKLVREIPDVNVSADSGLVHVVTRAPGGQEGRLTAQIKELAGNVPGVADIRVKVTALLDIKM